MHRFQREMQALHNRISFNHYNSIPTQNIIVLIILTIVPCQTNLSSLSSFNISMKKKNRSNLYSVNWIESKPIIKNF